MTRKYLVTCPCCKEKFYKEDTENVYHKNRYYHKDCYEKVAKIELDKSNLEQYIKELFSLENLSPLIKKQIKDYHEKEEYQYTYTGIQKTLEYFFVIKKNDKNKSKGIGIVPYVYDEARQYYYNLFLIEENNKDKYINKNIVEITIKSPKRKSLTNVRKIVLQEVEND